MSGPPARHHFLDACRATFMLLGVVRHAVLPFMPGVPWLVTAPDQNIALAYLYHGIGLFRMPGFFLVAGYFAALTLARRGAGAWVQLRIERLGIPLLFGVLCVVPIESLVLAVPAYLAVSEGSSASLLHLAAEQHGPFSQRWISHLWFLLDLLLMCLAFALVASARADVVGSAGRALSPLLRARAGGLVALLALGCFGIGLHVVAYSGPGQHLTAFGAAPFWGVLDLPRLLYFGPFFALGAVLAGDPNLMAQFLRPSALVWAAASVIAVVFITLHVHAPHLGWFLDGLGMIGAVLVVRLVLRAASLLIARETWLVREAVASSYTVYIVHHPLVLAIALSAIAMGLGGFWGFVVVLLVTTVLSVTIHLATRGVPLAVLLLNGIRPASTGGGRARVPPATPRLGQTIDRDQEKKTAAVAESESRTHA